MNDYVDLHTHTIASGHAYSTIEAMIKAADQKEIRLWHYRACSENAGNLQRVIF